MYPNALCDTELLVVYTLGKSGNSLSGKEIYQRVQEVMPEYLPLAISSIYHALGKLNAKDLAKIVKEIPVRGTMMRKHSLTPRGREIYDNIKSRFPLLDYLPDFDAVSEKCVECEEVEECWSRLLLRLDRLLKTRWGIKLGYPKNQLKKKLGKPMNLQELIYWLEMLKIPREVLKQKFQDVLDVLTISMDEQQK